MDYTPEQIDQQNYEIDSNPELQRSEFAPVAKEEMFHEKVYKTLVTLGDFKCYVWFYDYDYDESRTSSNSFCTRTPPIFPLMPPSLKTMIIHDHASAGAKNSNT